MENMPQFALKDLTSVESTTHVSQSTRNTYTFVRGSWTNVGDKDDAEYFRSNSSFIEKGITLPGSEPVVDQFTKDKEKLKKAGLDETNSSTLLNKHKTFEGVKLSTTLRELERLPKIGKKGAEKILAALANLE